jgi:hypothetical protein
MKTEKRKVWTAARRRFSLCAIVTAGFSLTGCALIDIFEPDTATFECDCKYCVLGGEDTVQVCSKEGENSGVVCIADICTVNDDVFQKLLSIFKELPDFDWEKLEEALGELGETVPGKCMVACAKAHTSICTPDIFIDRIDKDQCTLEDDGTSRETLLAAKSSSASFVGVLSSRSTAKVSINGQNANINLEGEIYIKEPPVCNNDSCPIEVQYLSLTNTNAFTIDGARVQAEGVKLTNNGFLRGKKDNGGTFFLHSSSQVDVKVTARKSGRTETGTVKLYATQPVAGTFSETQLRIDGSFYGEDLDLELHLIFPFTNIGPTSSFRFVPANQNTCGAGELVGDNHPHYVLDGRRSDEGGGRRIVSYSWFDAEGELIGETTSSGSRAAAPCYGVRSCPLLPIRLVVENDQGRTSDLVDAGESMMSGYSESNDNYGRALASGDFNNDGYADIVVGVPGDTAKGDLEIGHNGYCSLGSDPDAPSETEMESSVVDDIRAGSVHVIFGTPWGLSCSGNQIWHQGSDDVVEERENQDRFGNAVAVGDFNRDGNDDIAVGVPGESIGSGSRGGMVNVLYGSALGGMRSKSIQGTTANTYFHQGRNDVSGSSEDNDVFGETLASGDFDNDGYDDLAVGVPGENDSQGIVHIFYGSKQGLTADKSGRQEQLYRSTLGTASPAGQRFGSALLSEDLNDDGFDDLVIAVPWALFGLGDRGTSGAIHVMFGSSSGLGESSAIQLRSVDIPARPFQPRLSIAMFGLSLAAADFNNDTLMDLVVGAPNSNVNNVVNAGAIIVFSGHRDASDKIVFSTERSAVITESSQYVSGPSPISIWPVEDVVERGDFFGNALVTGQFNDDGIADLAVGVYGEAYNSVDRAGAVHIFYSGVFGHGGLSFSNDEIFNQSHLPEGETPEPHDRFGYAIAAADVDANGHDDLIVGVPYESRGRLTNSGIIQLVYARDHEGDLDPDFRFWDTIMGQDESCLSYEPTMIY